MFTLRAAKINSKKYILILGRAEISMFLLKFHDLSIFCYVAFVHVLSSSLCSLCPSALVKAATRMKLGWLGVVAHCGGARVASSLTSSSSLVTHTVVQVPRQAGWFDRAVLLPLLRNITRRRAMILLQLALY